MRRVSAFVWILGGMSIGSCAVAADPPAYNKTDTFAPGKKYTCVPTADRKNWDCSEAGKATSPTPAASPSPTPIAEPPRAVAPPAVAPQRTSTLPSYLTSAAAENSAPSTPSPSTISATADHANAPPAESFEAPHPSKPTPANATMPSKAATRSAAVSAKPAKPAPVARPVEAQKPRQISTANSGFMDLAGDHFVIELAHAPSQSSLAASRSAIHVPHGEVYELHLRQSGADMWLLLWGTFDSVDTARAARSQLAQSNSATLGFPRRIAPLQAEARRVSE